MCDSTGLRALVLAHKQAAAHHTELRLVITSAHVLRVLAITKLDTSARLARGGAGSPVEYCRGLPGQRLRGGAVGTYNVGYVPGFDQG